MDERARTGSWLLAALAGLLVPGGFLVAWWLVVERPTCEETGVFACSGPAIMLLLVGVPAAYVMWSLGMRAARASLPWLAPLAVMGALVVLVPLTDAAEPPLWAWLAVTAALCAAWARIPRQA